MDGQSSEFCLEVWLRLVKCQVGPAGRRGPGASDVSEDRCFEAVERLA